MTTDRLSLARVLVTGASGFIGRALCDELLRRGVDLVAAARHSVGDARCKWLQFELPGIVPRAALDGVDTVFHLAARAHAVAESGADAALYDLVNRQGTRDLAQAAAEAGAERFILMSSVKT